MFRCFMYYLVLFFLHCLRYTTLAGTFLPGYLSGESQQLLITFPGTIPEQSHFQLCTLCRTWHHGFAAQLMEAMPLRSINNEHQAYEVNMMLAISEQACSMDSVP